MSISVRTVIDRTRVEIIMDSDSSDFRWPDSAMVDYANQTAYELMSAKPHLLIDASSGTPSRSDDKVKSVTLATIDTATWPFPSRYEEAMMHGVAMRCFLQDAADQSNAARANYERTRFYECAGIRTQTQAQG